MASPVISAGRVRKPAAAAKPGCRPSTPFESRLYELCKLIPSGKVTTYGAMAAVLGSSARAVGQGMRRNPFAPIVPCHRVIAADLQLGGFHGSWGKETAQVQRKRSMLESEGVHLEGDKVAAKHVLGCAELDVLHNLKVAKG